MPRVPGLWLAQGVCGQQIKIVRNQKLINQQMKINSFPGRMRGYLNGLFVPLSFLFLSHSSFLKTLPLIIPTGSLDQFGVWPQWGGFISWGGEIMTLSVYDRGVHNSFFSYPARGTMGYLGNFMLFVTQALMGSHANRFLVGLQRRIKGGDMPWNGVTVAFPSTLLPNARPPTRTKMWRWKATRRW